MNSCERNYHRALKTLAALRVARAQAQPTAQPQEATTTSETPGSFRPNPATHPEPPANPAEILPTTPIPGQNLTQTA
jgi:hypothetical protein